MRQAQSNLIGALAQMVTASFSFANFMHCNLHLSRISTPSCRTSGHPQQGPLELRLLHPASSSSSSSSSELWKDWKWLSSGQTRTRIKSLEDHHIFLVGRIESPREASILREYRSWVTMDPPGITCERCIYNIGTPLNAHFRIHPVGLFVTSEGSQ